MVVFSCCFALVESKDQLKLGVLYQRWPLQNPWENRAQILSKMQA